MQSSKVLMKQLAIEHQGGPDQYEPFKKMIEASPLLYKNDLNIYTDEIEERHIRNIAEIKYIQQLIKVGKLSPAMLSTNVFNTYYPSYILNHHYSVFLPLMNKLSNEKDIQPFRKSAASNQITGAFFHETTRVDLKNSAKYVPIIDQKGIIAMERNVFFYSLVTSPYITHAAFISQTSSGKVLALVRIRDQQGDFMGDINYQDFGALVSKDYLPIAYNFNGTKPLVVIPLSEPLLKKVSFSHLRLEIAELGFSLKDFQKSLWITIKYTGMRKQFRTIEGSKDERSILTYEAVAARIINGFAEYEAFSDLFSKILNMPKGELWFGEIVKSAHHSILDHLIHLRECCGGYGYLQFSGHPGCIERVCARSGREPPNHPNLFTKFLKATHFYANKQMEEYFTQQITEKDIPYMKFFSCFITICSNMRQNKENMSAFQFRREFLRQAAIIAMHTREQFLRHESDNVHFQLLYYHLLGYIAKHAAFVNWGLIKIERRDFFESLRSQRAACFDNIQGKLEKLAETLELSFLRNTIVGRQNSEQFYDELIQASRSNRRNSKEYVDFIREPVIEMITQNRAKL